MTRSFSSIFTFSTMIISLVVVTPILVLLPLQRRIPVITAVSPRLQ